MFVYFYVKYPKARSCVLRGNLPSSVGGLDRWLCPSRLRLNTCVHACKLFSKGGGVALKLSGSCSCADIPALSSPRLGREVGENVK